MAEELHHVRTLTAARDKLVEERRALAGAIALGYRRRRTDDSHANDMRETFIALQNLIEAIDRAIAHEKTFASENHESFVVPALVLSEDALAEA
jgi:hypothetical protein